MRVVFLLFIFVLLTAACTTTTLEPASSDNFPSEVAADVVTVPPRPTATSNNVAPTRTRHSPAPSATPGSSATPIPLPTTLTLTPWPPDPIPTPTPVPPFPNMTYTTGDELWQINNSWEPELLATMSNILDVNGRSILFLQDGDIWLWDTAADVQTNISNTPDARECSASFWDGHAHKIIYQQQRQSAEDPFCNGNTFLHNTQTEETTPLEGTITADVAGSPDGRFLAYDLNGTELWLYDDEKDMVAAINLINSGFPKDTIIERLGSPSWSPDSEHLAVIMAVQPPDAPRQIVLGIFTLSNRFFNAHHPYQNVGRDGWFPPAQWSPTGEWIAFVAEDIDTAKQGIWIINTYSGDEKFISNAFQPIWSPDGQYLHYQTFWESSGLTQSFLTHPPDFTYKIEVFIPLGGQIIAWQSQK